MKVNIDCSLILLLLSGMLALLKIGGQFPYPWIWVLAPPFGRHCSHWPVS